ncbi:MAG: hypothetical protein KBE93_04790, partial [Tidjanibacter sp.]|nr:hypothetical protein [Tidjanibacter sp.]
VLCGVYRAFCVIVLPGYRLSGRVGKGSLIAFYTAETEKCAGMPDFFCSVRGYAMPAACFVAIFACKAYFGDDDKATVRGCVSYMGVERIL